MSKSISKEKRLLVYEKFHSKCAYCGCKIELNKMHVDHIIPLYRGYTNDDLKQYGKLKGTNNIYNLNPSCSTCNISKSTFTLDEWRIQLFLKIERLRKSAVNFRLLEKYNLIKTTKKEIIFYYEKVKGGSKNG